MIEHVVNHFYLKEEKSTLHLIGFLKQHMKTQALFIDLKNKTLEIVKEQKKDQGKGHAGSVHSLLGKCTSHLPRVYCVCYK